MRIRTFKYLKGEDNMSEILTGKNLEDAIKYMQAAIEESKHADCAKDTRGVVIVKNNTIIGRGANHPPKPLICVPQYCRDICRSYCGHAEIHAIINSIDNGFSPRGSVMYHANVKEGN